MVMQTNFGGILMYWLKMHHQIDKDLKLLLSIPYVHGAWADKLVQYSYIESPLSLARKLYLPCNDTKSISEWVRRRGSSQH
jgi:hypothetical protein